jgi:hypothetical protein
MESTKPPTQSQRPLRAYIEFFNGQLSIMPVANSDREERDVWDAIRVLFGERPGRQGELSR